MFVSRIYGRCVKLRKNIRSIYDRDEMNVREGEMGEEVCRFEVGQKVFLQQFVRFHCIFPFCFFVRF